MGNYILFSPVGNTDPISKCADGAMLHIARVYKPRKVVLYLSQQMVEYHRREGDNRYLRALEYLGKSMDFSFETEVIERPDLVEVQKFDIFYDDFQQIIERLAKENPNSTLLLNASSGSPAMKSALMFFPCLLPYRNIMAIQVNTPDKKTAGQTDNYDLDVHWACNKDNAKTLEYQNAPDKSRRTVVETPNLLVRMTKVSIKDQIASYNYTGALKMAEKIKPFLSDTAYRLLESAVFRTQLKLSEARDRVAGIEGISDFIPQMDKEELEMFEFILSLQLKLSLGLYADFLRATTPIIYTLMEYRLKQYHGIDITRYCDDRGRLNSAKLKADDKGRRVLSLLSSPSRPLADNTFYGSSHLYRILKNLGCDPKISDETPEDKQILKHMEILRDVESNARNPVAHTIIAVDDDWVKAKTGSYNSRRILETIKWLTRAILKGNVPKWDSYAKMNEILISELFKQPNAQEVG